MFTIRQLGHQFPHGFPFELKPVGVVHQTVENGIGQCVITNYHAFQLRELMDTNKVGKSLLQGRGEALKTQETEGQMVRRVAEELMGFKNVVVINDEAHHCYREKPDNEDIADLKGDEKKEAEKENMAARLWINGIEAFKRRF